MADPISIISLVEGSLGLILQCASAAQRLHDIAEKYKNATVTALSMRNEIDTISVAWKRIKEWSQECGDEDTIDSELLAHLYQSLEGGTFVVSALDHHLAKHTTSVSTRFIQRSKILWNESNLRDHQQRVRGQAIAVGLLLQTLQLRRPKTQTELYSKSVIGLRDSGLSSCSIVPSHRSSRFSGSIGTRDSNISDISADLVYRPLRFENDLFTARVYKRNYGNSTMFGGNSSVFPLAHSRARSSNGILHGSGISPDSDSALLKILLGQEPNLHLALLKAVDQLEVKNAKVLLAHGARVSDPYSNSPWTNLHFAASRGDIRLTKFLIQAGVDVAGRASGGMQPIHVACSIGSLDVVKELHAAGATIDCENDCGFQPLHIVANEINAPSVIQWLVQNGANINAETKTAFMETALQLAHRKFWLEGNEEALLRLGAKKNVKSSPLRPPLHQAVLSHFHRRVAQLLREGVDPNSRDEENGRTAVLSFALAISDGTFEKSKDWAIFEILFEYGADIKAMDSARNQVLHYFTKRTWYDKPYSTNKAKNRSFLLTYLIASGADPNAINAKQETPLSQAVKLLNFIFVETMLKTGAGYLLPSEKLRLRVHLHGLKSQSYLNTEPMVLDPGMTPERDEEVDKMLGLIRLLPEKVIIEEVQPNVKDMSKPIRRRNSNPL